MTREKDAPNPVPVLTIDGPGGSGKGTVSQLLAIKLGWHYLDSGVLYRLLAWITLKKGLSVSNKEELRALAKGLDLDFELRPGGIVDVCWDGQEVGDELRTEEAGKLASQIAADADVRQALLQRQRAFRCAPGLVADGRDMGTTVFPDALLKIFLIARPEVRAERRYKQLKEKGFDVNLSRLLGEIRDRDERDSARHASPLRADEDAIIVDSSNMSIEQVVDRINGLLQGNLLQGKRGK